MSRDTLFTNISFSFLDKREENYIIISSIWQYAGNLQNSTLFIKYYWKWQHVPPKTCSNGPELSSQAHSLEPGSQVERQAPLTRCVTSGNNPSAPRCPQLEDENDSVSLTGF